MELLLFDPDAGATLVPAPGRGAGWWAGAPSTCAWRGETLVAYRLRAPRPRRGYALRIARLRGDRLDDLGELASADLGTASLERAALGALDGGIRLYVSYVDPQDSRWRIDAIELAAPEAIDATRRRAVLTAATSGTEGVKDPVLLGARELLVSFTPVAASADHSSGDVFATGIAPSCTGRATSEDGLAWAWRGAALVPDGRGWDAYETRISCLLDAEHALYDGIATPEENYAERTGIARRAGERWVRVTTRAPILGARYVARAGDRFLYEYALPDGSHELRIAHATVAVDTDRIGGR